MIKTELTTILLRFSVIAYLLMAHNVCLTYAEPIRDDFSDGSIANGTPIAWQLVNGELSLTDGGIRLSNSVGDATILETADTNSTGWSMRVRALQEEGDVTGLGTTSGSGVTWATLNPNGSLLLGAGNGETSLDFASTGIDPTAGEFFLQLDTFDDELRAWAWPVGTTPDSTEPLAIGRLNTHADASAAFWVRDFSGENGGVSASTFRWFEFSDEHIPIPVPEPCASHLLLFGLSLLAARKRSRHQ